MITEHGIAHDSTHVPMQLNGQLSTMHDTHCM